jgi:hypothetical protein
VDPCLRRGGRLEREVDVTGSKMDRFKLLLALLGALVPKGDRGLSVGALVPKGDRGLTVGALVPKGDRGLTVGGHFANTEDISHVADIVADRTGECSEWGACQPLFLSGVASTWRPINYFVLSWMSISLLCLSLLTPALSA